MNCPRCEHRLKKRTIAQPGYRLVVDYCPGCEGTWFAPDQLKELEVIIEPAIVEIRDIPPAAEQFQEMSCPCCGPEVQLRKYQHQRDSKVILDYCPDCSGIWLDHGELDAIQKESWMITLGRIFRFLSGADRLETLR